MGSMNVGKVSFGNTPVSGTTQTAAQQPTVKKADKGDVVVIGGKEFTKTQVAVGGAGILAGAAVLATGIASYLRGKTAGIEGFTARIKEGFHTIVNKEARAEYAEKFGKKAAQAAEGAADKAAEGAADKTAEAAGDKAAAEAPAAAPAAAPAPAPAAEGAADKTSAAAAPAPEAAAAKSDKSKVTVQDLVKAQNTKNAAEAQVQKLQDEVQAGLHTQVLTDGTKVLPDGSKVLTNGTKVLADGTTAKATAEEIAIKPMIDTAPTAPKAPIKPVEPAEVKAPKKVVAEPVRRTRRGTTKLADIPEERLSAAEKKQLQAYNKYQAQKAAHTKYQADLADYQADLAEYETRLKPAYEAARTQYNVQLGAYTRYQNAQARIENAEERLTEAKGRLSEVSKGASKEVKKAAAGLSGQKIADLQKAVQEAMDALDNLPKTASAKQRENLQKRLTNAQDALFAYEQAIK